MKELPAVLNHALRCASLSLDASHELPDSPYLRAVDRLDELGMLRHLPFKKFEKSQHDRIDVLILVGGRSFRRGGKEYLAITQHCGAHLAVELGMRLEKGCVKPDALGIAHWRHFAAVLVSAVLGHRNSGCAYRSRYIIPS